MRGEGGERGGMFHVIFLVKHLIKKWRDAGMRERVCVCVCPVGCDFCKK